MKRSWLVGACLLFANTAALAAQKCPRIETAMVDKGFSEVAPWHVLSGGAGECSFMTANSSISFGFNHMVAASTEAATASAVSMREAVVATSLLEPMLVLGDEGFSYQPKNDAGKVDPKSMFFYGHRGSVNVSGYLNLKDAITPAQRDFAAHLIAATLGVASSPKALAKETNCPYLAAGVVKRLLPTGEVSAIVPNADSCVMSAGGKVITVSVTKNAQSRQMAESMLAVGGCTVDALPKLGKPSGLMHHCSEGNPRAEALFVSNGRMFRLVFVSTAEPSEDDRAAVAELAGFAARK
ncbi:MAG: hypothetical protein ABI843_14130 [Dokdonella sp.]